jgi:uncharacterized protein
MVEIQKELLPPHAILSYSEKDIRIQNEYYTHTTMVTQAEIYNTQSILSPQSLNQDSFKSINLEGIEVIIIGHSGTFAEISFELRQAFATQQVGIEVMNLGAACRTFNILLSEGRSVLGVFVVA